MDDGFLRDLRRAPAPDFSRRLRAMLGGLDRDTADDPSGWRPTNWLAWAASIAFLSVAFTFPAVRTGAQAFLDLFRISNFVGISVDTERLSQVDFNELDLPAMLGEQVEVLTEPAAPQTFETPAAAGVVAGIDVLEPAWLPVGWQRADITVRGASAIRVTVRTAPLRFLLEQLEIDDLYVPEDLDGQTATVRTQPTVETVYRGDREREARLIQAASPEVEFPAGMDLPVLAEIGLRILGLERDEAYRLAWTVDWRSTLLVPVPAVEAAFRDVNVAGSDGLLIEPVNRGGKPAGKVLIWATGDRVFALVGALSAVELLEMAQTAQ